MTAMTAARALAPFLAAMLVPAFAVSGWLGDARDSLAATQPASLAAPLAQMAEEGYCTQDLKQIVRRIAGACGLLDGASRGCQPADAARIVALSESDFNRLFLPLEDRVHIIQYEQGSAELDPMAQAAVESAWTDRRGASFFFVVSRASPEGSVAANQKLSADRAQAVLDFLSARFDDPDIKRQVGLLWLGEEFAQLPEDFCQWTRSRPGEPCDTKDINRSAIIAWIDCVI